MNGGFSIESSVPDKGIVTLLQQNDRKIVHLLYAHTTVRGKDTEVIEDIVPLYNIDVSVKCDKPEKVILVPQNEEINFTYADGKTSYAVASNFTPIRRENYPIGLPFAGEWREVLNTDAKCYGGRGFGNNGFVVAGDTGFNGKPFGALITLPPMSTIIFKHVE